MMKRSVTIVKKSAVYTYHNKRKVYDRNSLFLLKGDSFLRKSIVWFVDWKYVYMLYSNPFIEFSSILYS